MRIYFFLSVHHRLFHAMARELRDAHGVTGFGGFAWGDDQVRFLAAQGEPVFHPLHCFTRDIRPRYLGRRPDLDFLARCEARYGVPIHRMVFADRILVRGRPYEEVLARIEATFRAVERNYEEARPDWVVSEDVSCATSFVHWAVARRMGIPFFAIGSGKLPDRVGIHSSCRHQWDRADALFGEVSRRGLSAAERGQAATYLDEFQKRPIRFAGQALRSRLPVANRYELKRLAAATAAYLRDSDNPNLVHPARLLYRRARRLARDTAARAAGLFERPVEGERFVLYPIHLQPEATTLVLAPYYLDQLALIEDIAKSLPVGYRLYVKEHTVTRGRRPLADYQRLRDTFGVRLLAPEEDTWTLIRNAAAIAVITGTVGWEGLLFEKPVVTFGNVFFNSCPLVFRAGLEPKERWAEVFRRAIFEHRPDREVLLAYLHAVLATTYPGVMGNPESLGSIMEPENVRRLARALMDHAGAAGRTRAAEG